MIDVNPSDRRETALALAIDYHGKKDDRPDADNVVGTASVFLKFLTNGDINGD